MKFTITATTKPECENFFQIRAVDEHYQSIDEFIKTHPDNSGEFLNNCMICYRGREQLFRDYLAEYDALTESMQFVHFQQPNLILDSEIKAAGYFTKKSIECLQFARFFIIKSALKIDTDFNLSWSQGYVPQFYFRCIYFGTACTWIQNAFDHVLQSVYWGLKLFTSVKDRDGLPYDSSWDTKKIMGNCTYEFVVGELKNRGLKDCRKHLTKGSSKTEEVRKWANYIKHKGGIDYKYLEADSPMEVYFVPVGEAKEDKKGKDTPPEKPDEKYRIKDFKSPVEIDIDVQIKDLIDAYVAVFNCINETISDIDYNKHSVKVGGAK